MTIILIIVGASLGIIAAVVFDRQQPASAGPINVTIATSTATPVPAGRRSPSRFFFTLLVSQAFAQLSASLKRSRTPTQAQETVPDEVPTDALPPQEPMLDEEISSAAEIDDAALIVADDADAERVAHDDADAEHFPHDDADAEHISHDDAVEEATAELVVSHDSDAVTLPEHAAVAEATPVTATQRQPSFLMALARLFIQRRDRSKKGESSNDSLERNVEIDESHDGVIDQPTELPSAETEPAFTVTVGADKLPPTQSEHLEDHPYAPDGPFAPAVRDGEMPDLGETAADIRDKRDEIPSESEQSDETRAHELDEHAEGVDLSDSHATLPDTLPEFPTMPNIERDDDLAEDVTDLSGTEALDEATRAELLARIASGQSLNDEADTAIAAGPKNWLSFAGKDATLADTPERERILRLLDELHEAWCIQHVVDAVAEETDLRPLAITILAKTYHDPTLREAYEWILSIDDLTAEERAATTHALETIP